MIPWYRLANAWFRFVDFFKGKSATRMYSLRQSSLMYPPVVIEAVQLRWDNWNEMCDFAGVGKLEDRKPSGRMDPDYAIGLDIPTSEGVLQARENDWVIRVGFKKELDICKPDIFEATYEPVSD